MGKLATALLLACAIVAPATAADRAQHALAAGITRGHSAPDLPWPPAGPHRGLIAIILDDLGEQRLAGERAARLPGAVACAFLPNGAYTAAHARLAHERDKEVMLHLPLQPGHGARAYPTAITVNTGRREMAEYLRRSLASVPFARGVNNHQGSLLTARPEAMDWLMQEFSAYPGLFFVDSRTSVSSVAFRAAVAHGVPATERNVFLDSVRGIQAVRAAFRALIHKARRNERAIAIGHPYPETFAVLEEELPRLAEYGVRLVGPSEIIARQQGQRGPWKDLKLSSSLSLNASTPDLPRPAATSATAH